MNSRIPLIVAVVGALLIGGATTGSTRASWTSQATLQQHSVASGKMSYTATSPSGVTLDKVATSTADRTIVLDDTSLGKNLMQRITASVASTPVGVTATIGTTCPGAASVFVDMTPTSPDQTLCVRVTSSTTAVNGNVTINLSSAQRPTAGWTTVPITRAVAVDVINTVTVPAQPTLTCGGTSASTSNSHTFTWGTVTGASTYTVYRADGATSNADANYAAVLTGTTATSYEAGLGGNQTSFFRVKSVNTAGASVYSNTLRIVRSGSNVTCTAVTP